MATQYSLQVLGVAGGSAPAYQGRCSSSFLILRDEQPYCLVDLGLGVTRTLLEAGFSIPERILITHNHSDHAGELPVVLRVEQARGRRLQVIAESAVAQRLQQHRLAEHAEQIPPQQLADWAYAAEGEAISLDQGLSVRFYCGQHSERCCGFVLSCTDSDGTESLLLGYSGDSGLCPALYQQINQAYVTLYDARPNGNAWHASFEQIQPWLTPNSYLIGHGLEPASAPADQPLLWPGQRINLQESR